MGIFWAQPVWGATKTQAGRNSRVSKTAKRAALLPMTLEIAGCINHLINPSESRAGGQIAQFLLALIIEFVQAVEQFIEIFGVGIGGQV